MYLTTKITKVHNIYTKARASVNAAEGVGKESILFSRKVASSRRDHISGELITAIAFSHPTMNINTRSNYAQ